MSFQVEALRSASDDNVPSFLREAENGTTTAVRHNTLLEWSVLGKGARIINNDATNNLDVRLHSPQGTILVIPPSSELSLNEWFSQIHVEPDGTSGSFQLILEVATMEDARKLR